MEIAEISGVTTNPSLIAKERPDDVFTLLREIRKTIGDKELHVQVLGNERDEIIKDSIEIINNLGIGTYIKIPLMEEGYKAIKYLRDHFSNIRITGTAAYTMLQTVMAINHDIDYIAFYVNRMENEGIQAAEIIKESKLLANKSGKTHILAASFKNINQVTNSFCSGADACTIPPSLLLPHATFSKTADDTRDFRNEWYEVFHMDTIRPVLS